MAWPLVAYIPEMSLVVCYSNCKNRTIFATKGYLSVLPHLTLRNYQTSSDTYTSTQHRCGCTFLCSNNREMCCDQYQAS